MFSRGSSAASTGIWVEVALFTRGCERELCVVPVSTPPRAGDPSRVGQAPEPWHPWRETQLEDGWNAEN